MLCTWIDSIPDGYASDGGTLVTSVLESTGTGGGGVAGVNAV